MSNKLQRYSRQLSKANSANSTPTWRGQPLEQITECWDDSLDIEGNPEPAKSWIKRVAGKLPANDEQV